MTTLEPGYELIAEIEAIFLNRIQVSGFQEFGKGHVALKHNGPIPRIVVVDVGGGLATGVTETTGGANGDLATDETRWDVFVWGNNLAECRALYYEFLRACRERVGTPNVGFERQYRMDESSNSTRGRLLIQEDLVLRTAVAEFTEYDFSLVEVQRFRTQAGHAQALPEFDDNGDRIEYDYETLKAALVSGGDLEITQTTT